MPCDKRWRVYQSTESPSEGILTLAYRIEGLPTNDSNAITCELKPGGVLTFSLKEQGHPKIALQLPCAVQQTDLCCDFSATMGAFSVTVPRTAADLGAWRKRYNLPDDSDANTDAEDEHTAANDEHTAADAEESIATEMPRPTDKNTKHGRVEGTAPAGLRKRPRRLTKEQAQAARAAAKASEETIYAAEVDAEYEALGLHTPSVAQLTKVVVIKGLLSLPEINAVRDQVGAAHRSGLLGTLRRGTDGLQSQEGAWRTNFLHSEGFFSDKMPALRDKLWQTVCRVDSENWDLFGQRDLESINFRTVESHKYGSGGKLSELGHYDSGSLLTLDIMLSEPGVDFDGGNFIFPNRDGSNYRPEICQGDAMVFLSHK